MFCTNVRLNYDYNHNLSQDVINWAKSLKGQGVKLYILSNTNNKEKVKSVADKLDIKFRNLAKKPLKIGFKKVKEELNENEKNIAVVGDQIFTDVIGGNRCKMFTILVEPVDKRDFWYTAWKRPLENIIKSNYRRKKCL